jgi:hypothetical protein
MSSLPLTLLQYLSKKLRLILWMMGYQKRKMTLTTLQYTLNLIKGKSQKKI